MNYKLHYSSFKALHTYLQEIPINIYLKIFIENGNLYEGHFTNGKKEGRGVFYHLEKRQVQEGCWENDVCVNSTIEDIRQPALSPILHIPRINSRPVMVDIMVSRFNGLSRIRGKWKI